MNVSLCMIVKNEEKHLERCLNSVQGVVDEIIVVDTGSTDQTIEIARKFGATIVEYEWSNDFSAARNAGLELAKGDYILVLDADEELEGNARKKMNRYLKKQAQGYMFLIENYHNGEITSGSVMRLFRNRPEYRFHYPIHEQIEIIYEGSTPLILTDILIKHYGYTREETKRKDKRKRNREILESMITLKHPYFLYQLAIEYTSIEKHMEAYPLFEEAYSIVDQDRIYYPEVIAGFMSNCFHTQRYEKVHELYRENIERFKDYTDLYSMDGKTYLKQGNYIEALKQFRMAYGRKPNPIYKCTHGIDSYKTIIDIGQTYEIMGEKQFASQCYLTAFRMKPSSDIFLLLLDFLGDSPDQIKRMIDDLSKYIRFDDEMNLHVVLFRLLLNGQLHSYEQVRQRYCSIKVNDKLFQALIDKDIEVVIDELVQYEDNKSQFVISTIQKYIRDETMELSELAMLIALQWDSADHLLKRVKEIEYLDALHLLHQYHGLEQALPFYIEAYQNNVTDVLSLQRIGDALLNNGDRNAAAQMYYQSYKQHPTSTNIFRLIEAAMQNSDLRTAYSLLEEGLTYFKESILLGEVRNILKNEEILRNISI